MECLRRNGKRRQVRHGIVRHSYVRVMLSVGEGHELLLLRGLCDENKRCDQFHIRQGRSKGGGPTEYATSSSKSEDNLRFKAMVK